MASYTYDALGRRTSFADPVAGVTTYYYYAGKQVIEEYSAAGTRLRYHINGGQYIDEQIATYDEAAGEFTYYLAGEQFSVIGTGNADGSVIEAYGYSPGGDFGGAGACADFDADGDVDADDFAALAACFSGPDVPVAAGCEDKDLDHDGDVDGMDYVRLQLCMSGEGVAPPPGCEGTPASGSFALHGRPVDVLSDGLVLIPVRARTYDPRHGRWLQRDPTGYADGANLYEAFRGNATAFTDPSGESVGAAVGLGVLLWLIMDKVAEAPSPSDTWAAIAARQAEHEAAVWRRTAVVATLPAGVGPYNLGRMWLAKYTGSRAIQVAGGSILGGTVHSIAADVASGDVQYYITDPGDAALNAGISETVASLQSILPGSGLVWPITPVRVTHGGCRHGRARKVRCGCDGGDYSC